MKLSALEQKLMKAARATPPSERVPYAFEQRIMARLAGAELPDLVTVWGHALWRAAGACLAIALLSGAWVLWQEHDSGSSGDFSQEFETAVFVMADQPHDSW